MTRWCRVKNALNISHYILLIAFFHFPNWIAFFIIQSTRKWFIKFSPHTRALSNTQFQLDTIFCHAKRDAMKGTSLDVQRNWKEKIVSPFIMNILCYDFFPELSPSKVSECERQDENFWKINNLSDFFRRTRIQILAFWCQKCLNMSFIHSAPQSTLQLNIRTVVVGIEHRHVRRKNMFLLFVLYFCGKSYY